jgi:hypothetical protein
VSIFSQQALKRIPAVSRHLGSWLSTSKECLYVPKCKYVHTGIRFKLNSVSDQANPDLILIVWSHYFLIHLVSYAKECRALVQGCQIGRIFVIWGIVYFFAIFWNCIPNNLKILGYSFPQKQFVITYEKVDWATFWPIFSQKHLVTLLRCPRRGNDASVIICYVVLPVALFTDPWRFFWREK